MAWFNRKDKNISSEKNKKDIPSGLWVKCPSCSEIQYKPELEKNNMVCRKCEHHFRVKPSLYYDLLAKKVLYAPSSIVTNYGQCEAFLWGKSNRLLV